MTNAEFKAYLAKRKAELQAPQQPTETPQAVSQPEDPYEQSRRQRTMEDLRGVGEGIGAAVTSALPRTLQAIPAATSAAMSYLGPEQGTWDERYQRRFAELEADKARLAQAAPYAAKAGEMARDVGAGFAMPGAGPLVKTAQTLGPLSRAAAGALEAPLMSALYSGATEGPQAAAEAAQDPMAAALGAAPGLLGAAKNAGLRGARAVSQEFLASPVTRDAQELMGQGINLTTGQMLSPKSSVAELEKVSAHRSPSIAEARQAAKTDLMKRAVEMAAPEGMPLPRGGIHEMVGDVKQGFNKGYEAVGKSKTLPLTLATMTAPGGVNKPAKFGKRLFSTPTKSGVFDDIINNPDYMLTEEERTLLKNYVEKQKTRLADPKGQKSSLEEALSVRSDFRALERELRKTPDPSNTRKANALDELDDALTQTLDDQLPRDARDKLYALDRQYPKFKQMEDVVGGGKAGGEFSIAQLRQGLRRSVGKSRMARGQGGEYQDLVSQAEKVLEPEYAGTGQLLFKMGANTKHVAPFISEFLNTPLGRSMVVEGVPLPASQPSQMDPRLRNALLLTLLRQGDSNVP